MTDTILEPCVAPSPSEPASPAVIIRDALVESRHRWQNLLALAVDMAFETDAKGRFVFMSPDLVLGWPAGTLVGQPSELLVSDDATQFSPFRPATEVRRHRVWLRCFDGGLAMMSVSATPLYDSQGAVVGARGIGVDMTSCDGQTAQIAGRLRRGEVIDHILWRVGQETGADAMMDAALWALIHALGAEGAAVIGSPVPDAAIEILHECGPGASMILPAATKLVAQHATEAGHATNPDGRLVLAIGCRTRFGANAGLAVWRRADTRKWDTEDTLLTGSAIGIVRMILDYEAVAREIAYQARTDPLTGLLNRRAFLDEMQRHLARLDREHAAGTLMFVDLDAFKMVNDRLGHAVGDEVLVHVANLLRKMVRPSDLIARLGGDEFAVWLGSADHMTAAERADVFCRTAPVELQAALPEAFPDLGVSIGIATRQVGSCESIEDLTRRADLAMYEVKRSGRRHWRVSLLGRA